MLFSTAFQGNEVANNVCTKKPTPFRRPQRRTKMPARFLTTPSAGRGTLPDDNSALNLLEFVLHTLTASGGWLHALQIHPKHLIMFITYSSE